MQLEPLPWETATVIRSVSDDGAVYAVQVVSSNKDREFILDIPLPMARDLGWDVKEVSGVPWVILETMMGIYFTCDIPLPMVRPLGWDAMLDLYKGV